MADYYTKFSLVILLPDVAAQAYALSLAQQARGICQGDAPPHDFPAALVEYTESWDFETEADIVEGRPGLWLHSEYGGINGACGFLQHLLQKFNPKGKVSFEWSHDCSKPRTDAYGGGAAIITARKIKTMSTSEWLQKHAA